MLIRKATLEDSPIIATYLLLAMEEIVYEFIGEKSPGKARIFLSDLTAAKGNQYSYENGWVAELEDEIVAAALVYDGARLKELREPVGLKVKTLVGKEFNPEDETQAGEYYIDCLAVSPDQQGKGIGAAIIQFLIDEYAHKNGKTIGLLVDRDNPGAKKLYLKLGFEVVGTKTLVGKQLEHLQFTR